MTITIMIMIIIIIIKMSFEPEVHPDTFKIHTVFLALFDKM